MREKETEIERKHREYRNRDRDNKINKEINKARKIKKEGKE